MEYDFDQAIDRRGTNSVKWDRNEQLFGREDVLDMWVADMDFACPEPVIQALRDRLDHPLFGYSFPPESLYQAIIDRLDRAYGWQVKKEWILFTPGVVTGIIAAIDALTVTGDEVVVQPPVYGPFFSAIANTGCQIVENQLRLDGNQYRMDFDDLQHKFATSEGYPAKTHRIRAMLLCSPHNPGGRVWRQEELERLAEICLDNDCAIISDEIHCDLLVGDVAHTPLATLDPQVQQQTITLMAPSKTYNLAGLKASFAIVPNASWRQKIRTAQRTQGGVAEPGLVAMEAALRHGDDYIEQLCDYLRGNIEYFCDQVEKMPGLRPIRPQGTYLVWVDMRRLGLDDDQLQDLLVDGARLATNPGYGFGSGGEGFHRFNLACPRSRVEEAVRRLRSAIDALTHE